MSEYWKSVPRKFCDFCKCWLTDNKPSIDFHERGKRHQENVELRLKEVRKKSLQQSREDELVKSQMDQMEKAALEAFKKDLKDNPALAAQYGISTEPKPKPATDASASSSTTNAEEEDVVKKKKRKKIKAKEWYEAKSPAGYSYYWSTITNETKWEAPEEFMSLEEQKLLEEEAAEAEKAKAEKKKAKKHDSSKTTSETSASKPVVQSVVQPAAETSSTKSAFGGWEVVREVERPQMYDEASAPPALDEIPMPVQASEETKPPEPNKPRIKFKEKVVTLGPSKGGPVAFKKRKIGGARNMRQKDGDE